MLIFPFVSTGVCERGRGICVEVYGYVLRSVEGWEDDFVALMYALVSTVS